ncbi:MAG: hypothetical protein MOB07_07965 [Acidobacteria bacterium]|nr:hypothetical protein [Acidobacteriota bacterium]
MLTRRRGKRRFRLRMNGISGFSPRAARSAIKRPRCAPKETIERVATARLPTEYGEFRITGYRSLVSDEEFVALVRGE